MHTNATVLLLVTFSIAVTTRQYVGNPIDCVHTRFVSLIKMEFIFSIFVVIDYVSWINLYLFIDTNFFSFFFFSLLRMFIFLLIFFHNIFHVSRFMTLHPIYRDIPEDVLNTYCWIHSTYTIVDAFMRKQGQEVPFPGVDNSQARGSVTIRHTKYYQWVAFTLFFQVSF